MRSVVARLSWNQAIGIYVDEEWIIFTRVAGTPIGTVILERSSMKVGSNGIKDALKQVIDSSLAPRLRKRVPVSVGIGAELTFFATCVLENELQDGGVSMEALLEASGAATAWEQDNAVADSIQIKIAGHQAYSVAACRKDLAGQIFEALNEMGVKFFRLEPAPYSLLAAAGRRAMPIGSGNVWRLRSGSSPPRKWKVFVHVLLDEWGSIVSEDGSKSSGSGLAILVVDGWPVLWRRFAVVTGQEAGLITSTVRVLLIHALRKIGIKKVKGIVLQVPLSDKKKISQLAQEVIEESGMDVVGIPLYLDNTDERESSIESDGKDNTEGQDLASEETSQAGATNEQADRLGGFSNAGRALGRLCSLGLALSIKSRPVSGSNLQLDIVSSLRPPPTLKDMFPRNLAIFMVIIIAGMGAMMWNKSSSMAGQHRSLRRQNASHKWASALSITEINKQRKSLLMEVDCVYRFLGTRIIWSDYLRDIPTRLPRRACLVNVWANCEMKEMVKKKRARKPKKSLTLTAMARFSSRSSAPREIDAFLQSLRDMKLLQRDFPLVELAEVKWRKEGKSGMALFTVVALPRTSKGKK